MNGAPTVRDVHEAAERIRGFVRETPLARSRWLSDEIGAEVLLKLECFQETGSFKIRGAANRLLTLRSDARIVAVSAGNHARAVAECAERLGLRATVVMPVSAAATKVAAIQRYRVEVMLSGGDYDEAERIAVERARADGATFVSPYNDAWVIAGQGTAALEAIEQAGPVDAMIVPTGGGGLLAGAGIVARGRGCAVVGAQPAAAATVAACFAAGKQVSVTQGATLADGLSGNLEPGSITVPIALETVDRFLRVTEAQIASAVAGLLEHEHVLAEPSAAVGVAALLADRDAFRGARVVVLVTGANVGVDSLLSMLR